MCTQRLVPRTMFLQIIAAIVALLNLSNLATAETSNSPPAEALTKHCREHVHFAHRFGAWECSDSTISRPSWRIMYWCLGEESRQPRIVTFTELDADSKAALGGSFRMRQQCLHSPPPKPNEIKLRIDLARSRRLLLEAQKELTEENPKVKELQAQKKALEQQVIAMEDQIDATSTDPSVVVKREYFARTNNGPASSSCPSLIYPPASLRQNEFGTVEILVRLSAAGAVTATSVVTSSGFDRLDRAAASYAASCTYTTLHGAEPSVGSEFIRKVNFQMDDQVPDSGELPASRASASGKSEMPSNGTVPFKLFNYQGTWTGPLIGQTPDGFGVFEGSDKSETVRIEGSMKKGVKDGVFKFFNAAGDLDTMMTYVDGVLDGPAVDFADKDNMRNTETLGMVGTRLGDKVSQGNYVNGKPDGEWYTFMRENDQLVIIRTTVYSNGEQTRIIESHRDNSAVDFAAGLAQAWLAAKNNAASSGPNVLSSGGDGRGSRNENARSETITDGLSHASSATVTPGLSALNSGTATSQSALSRYPGSRLAHCVHLDPNRTGLNNSYLVNTCNESLYVEFTPTSGDGAGAKGMETVRAGGRTEISGTNGITHVIVCRQPDLPDSPTASCLHH